jgi:hypothetical protein
VVLVTGTFNNKENITTLHGAAAVVAEVQSQPAGCTLEDFWCHSHT